MEKKKNKKKHVISEPVQPLANDEVSRLLELAPLLKLCLQKVL